MYSIDLWILHIFNNAHTIVLDGMMATLTSGYTWIPLYLVLIYVMVRLGDSILSILVSIGCGLISVLGSSLMCNAVVKPLVERVRPTFDADVSHTLNIVDGITGSNTYSFYSSHAATTFALAAYVWLVMRDRTLSWTVLAWSLLMCWTRLYLGVHYPSDIIVGIIAGAVFAYGGFWLHGVFARVFHLRQRYVQDRYQPSNDRGETDIVPATLLATILVALIVSLCKI